MSEANFVYNENVLHLVDAKLSEIREILLKHAVKNACEDPSCMRDDGKAVVNVTHMMNDKALGLHLVYNRYRDWVN